MIKELEHRRYKKAPGSGEYFFDVISEEITNDAEFIIANGIKNIQICSSDLNKIFSMFGSDQFLFLRKLELAIDDKTYSNVEKLINLDYLVINESISNINFGALTNLQSLFFVYNKNQKGLEKLCKLQEISVSKADGTFLNVGLFENFEGLKKLEIVKSDVANGVSFLSRNKALENLEIYSVKNRINVEELLFLRSSLKELRISKSPNIVGYEVLKKFTCLEKLVFNDCNAIENCAFVNDMPKLKQLTVMGKSFLVDGNINGLKREGLTVGIDNKKHYSLNSNQFLNYFRTPPESMP